MSKKYWKTGCTLGTVFQDQVSFLVRRKKIGFPELLSNPSVCLACNPVEVEQGLREDREMLRRYRFLSSLFFDESDLRFESENFGLLTPFEVYDKYEDSYDDRFNAYFGRALGGVLELLPGMHQ